MSEPKTIEEARELLKAAKEKADSATAEAEHLRNLQQHGPAIYKLTDPADVPMQWRADNEKELNVAREKFAASMAKHKAPVAVAEGLWKDALLDRYKEVEMSSKMETENFYAELEQWFGPGDGGVALFEKAAQNVIEKADDDDMKNFVNWGLLDDGEAKEKIMERITPTTLAALTARLGGTGGKPAPAPAPGNAPPSAAPPTPGNNAPPPGPGVFHIAHGGQTVIIDSTTAEGRKKAINETFAMQDQNTGQFVRDMPHFKEAVNAVVSAEAATMR